MARGSIMTLIQWCFVTLGFVLVADLGLIFVRRRINLAALRPYHEVTDPLLAVCGTLFAILLGFMVANAMTRFEEARNNVQMEAGAVGDVFRLADAFPDGGAKLRKDCLRYAEIVVSDEWKLMERRKLSDEAWNVYGDMWSACIHFEPKTQGLSNVHETILTAMSQVGQARRARFAQLSYALPTSLWIVVSFGAISTILFLYLFGVEKLKLHLVMTTIVTVVLSLNIFLLVCFDDPFDGDVRISSAPFEADITIMRSVLGHSWH
jgi:hypothetical protein